MSPIDYVKKGTKNVMKNILVVTLIFACFGCITFGCPDDDEDPLFDLHVEDISVYDRYVDVTVHGTDGYYESKRMDDGTTGIWTLERGNYVLQGLSADAYAIGPVNFTIDDADVHFLIDDITGDPFGIVLVPVP